MATIIDDYNIGKIIEKALLSSLKDVVVANITTDLTEEFRAKAEQIVRAEVEKVSIKGAAHFRDLYKMRDEVKIYCEWNNT